MKRKNILVVLIGVLTTLMVTIYGSLEVLAMDTFNLKNLDRNGDGQVTMLDYIIVKRDVLRGSTDYNIEDVLKLKSIIINQKEIQIIKMKNLPVSDENTKKIEDIIKEMELIRMFYGNKDYELTFKSQDGKIVILDFDSMSTKIEKNELIGTVHIRFDKYEYVISSDKMFYYCTEKTRECREEK